MSSIRRKITRRNGRYSRPARRSTKLPRYRRVVRTTYRRRRKVEVKVKDVTTDGQVFGSTLTSAAGGSGNAYAVLLNGVAQGADWDERIGRKVYFRNAILSYSVQHNEASTSANRVHVALVRDKVPTGTLATASLVYDKFGLRDLDNTPRFRVLYHKTHNLPAGTMGTTDVQSPSRHVLKTIPLKFETTYNDTAATLGAISGDAVYLMIWGENAVDGLFEGKIRMRFTED